MPLFKSYYYAYVWGWVGGLLRKSAGWKSMLVELIIFFFFFFLKERTFPANSFPTKTFSLTMTRPGVNI